MPSIYWPEEGTPDFVSHDDEQTWTPLCDDCGREMDEGSIPNGMWHCHNYDAHGARSWMIAADEWPDYDEDDH